ncbi:hypothetical protein ABIA06_003458 [Bradyrhizobium yuanmingense]|uniref:hypothetical protein n=1 Tax=Bradyrhizobium yuanmingense TaxID=108015 RepID=UPI003514ABE5
MFHKILKSGCKAEESKLRTAQRLTNLISLFCILSWRVFWMTMLNRSAADAPPTPALTATEIGVLGRLVNDEPKARNTLSQCLIKIAPLGGYLARASDPPPGNSVRWRGLSRLTDIAGHHGRSRICMPIVSANLVFRLFAVSLRTAKLLICAVRSNDLNTMQQL